MRNEIRQRRRAVPESERRSASAKICERISKLPKFQSASQVAGFLAFDGEADPLGLMTLAAQHGKNVYVPIIIAKGQPLRFAPWWPDVPIKHNSLGIAEPDLPLSQLISGEQLEFVVTPLVAFDEHGTRLGVGGGFYDRSFKFLNQHDPVKPRPTMLIGIAYEIQKMPVLEKSPWDVSLDGVVTEVDFYPFKHA